MSGKVYAIPVLGRYGLTHGILSWARALIWCKQNGATMLAPFWLTVRIGPYLRRERDKRNYFLLFHKGAAVGGAKRLAILVRSKKIDIGAEWPSRPAASVKPTVLRFHNALKANEQKSFHQIVEHGPFLREQLLAITHNRYHPRKIDRPFIAIHVRLGDFSAFTPQEILHSGSTNCRLPIDWYSDRLLALRTAIGMPIPAIIFSDGSDADLAHLLNLPGVERAPRQQSISDLLEIGLGVALIASGSGFSLWGAFLGSTPRISYPGQSKVPINVDLSRDIELNFGDAIPPSFLSAVMHRILV
jgi:hypothetical protein